MLKRCTVDVHTQNTLNFVCPNLNLGIWKFQERSIFWSKNLPCLEWVNFNYHLITGENIELLPNILVFLSWPVSTLRKDTVSRKHRERSRWAWMCKDAISPRQLFSRYGQDIKQRGWQRLQRKIEDYSNASRPSNHLKKEDK